MLIGGFYGGKGLCLQCRSEITSGSNFRPTAVYANIGITLRDPPVVLRFP